MQVHTRVGRRLGKQTQGRSNITELNASENTDSRLVGLLIATRDQPG